MNSTKTCHFISKQKISALWIFSGCLFVYVALRGYFLSFTHDESLSFQIITGDLLLGSTANNHILNTLFMKICHKLFGDSEFSLRLPNILSFALYLYGTVSLLKQLKNGWLILLGSTFLLMNPYILEFFSLARGYGLSIGFMMMSIMFQLHNFCNHGTLRSIISSIVLSLVFGSLAIGANLGMINFYIAILMLSFSQAIVYVKTNSKSTLSSKISLISILLIAVIPIYSGITRLLLLNKTNQLYFGEESLFNMIYSLIKGTFYFTDIDNSAVFLIRYIALSLLFFGVIISIIKRDIKDRLTTTTFLFLIIATGLFLEHILFGALYPSGRTALYFLPIFGLFITYLFSNFFELFAHHKLQLNIIIVLIATPLIFYFSSNISIKRTITWPYDAYTKDVMVEIHKQTLSRNGKATISNNWLFEPAINYYISSRTINLKPANRDGANFSTDFIYEMDFTQQSDSFIVLSKFEENNGVLLMRIGTK